MINEYSIIKQINSNSDLTKTLEFLKKGFNENKFWKKKLFNHIIKSNRSIGYYGYLMLDKKENICGALLLIGQSKSKHNKNNFILNISGWYMLPEYRGLKAILFAKEVVKRCENNILTSFTPSESVIPIWLRLGFKKKYVSLSTISLLRSLKNIRFKNNLKISLVNYDSVINKYEEVKNVFSLGNISFYKINYKNTEILIGGSKKILRRNIFKNICFSIPIYVILWTSNNELFNNIFYEISLLILLKTKSIFVRHFNLYSKKISLNNNNKFFKVWNKESTIVYRSDIPNESINLLGSELSIETI